VIELTFAALVILQILDAGTTYVVIKRGGAEGNPLLVGLQARLRAITGSRWAWLVIAKIVALALVAYLYYSGAATVLNVLCVVYLVVIVNNIIQIRKLKPHGE
jgi:ABC-type siderophore export system fused ATPase/permease subunit